MEPYSEKPVILVEYNEEEPIELIWNELTEGMFTEDKKGRKTINEGVFANAFKAYNKLVYVNGMFYSPDGALSADQVRRDIYQSLRPYIASGLERQTNSFYGALTLEAGVDKFDFHRAVIPLANGDLEVFRHEEWAFHYDSKRHAPYRLPVCYSPKPLETPYFDKWVKDLLYPEDIVTLQELLGYLLLPDTQGQEAFFLLGAGGAGKSVMGNVVEALMGRAYLPMETEKLAQDKFKLAELENKLVLYDDDLNEAALSSTGLLKKIITNEIDVTAERKYGQPFQFRPYCRVVACGNFMLSALYDSSDAFYRRLHPLLVKERIPQDQVIRGFGRLVAGEAQGILQWALIGLKRLLDNDYRFTWSQRSRDYMAQTKAAANHFPEFADEVFTSGGSGGVSSKEIARLYRAWCEVNGCDSRKVRSMQSWMRDNCERYGMKYSNNLERGGVTCRGYTGVKIRPEWEKYVSPTLLF